MPSFRVNTEFGTFQIKHENNLLSVGGKKYCVQLVYKKNDESEMLSLQTKYGGCELTDKIIKGENTVKMVLLAFTIFREYYPDVEEVFLIDSSSIDCEGSPMGLMKSSLLLHGYTYYERKFQAVPVLEEDVSILDNFRKAYNNIWDSPPIFSFINDSFEKLLRPLYENSNSWSDFSKKLIEKFGERRVCYYIYPWFLNAIYKISPREVTSRWKININNKPIIPYKKIMNSGKTYKKQRKNKNDTKFIQSYKPIIDTSKITSLTPL